MRRFRNGTFAVGCCVPTLSIMRRWCRSRRRLSLWFSAMRMCTSSRRSATHSRCRSTRSSGRLSSTFPLVCRGEQDPQPVHDSRSMAAHPAHHRVSCDRARREGEQWYRAREMSSAGEQAWASWQQ
ncbi:hypothetical protein VPH35_065651 [Triticum aestivum]